MVDPAHGGAYLASCQCHHSHALVNNFYHHPPLVDIYPSKTQWGAPVLKLAKTATWASAVTSYIHGSL